MVMGYRTCCERRFWSKLASFNTQAQRFCDTRRLRQAQKKDSVRALAIKPSSTGTKKPAPLGCGAGLEPDVVRRSAHGVGQLDLHFEHFQVVLALQLHLEVFGVDLHVLGDHGDQLSLQRGQVVGLGGIAAVALVRQDDL